MNEGNKVGFGGGRFLAVSGARRLFEWRWVAAVATAFAMAGVPAGAAPSARPNIILVLADDLGYSDLGCYGGEIDTPNLDRLAAHGLRFTQFYNAARCCPSRASVMTGLYPSRTGMGHMTSDLKLPGYRGEISGACPTMAERLRAAGYRTYMVGKWHLVLPGNMEPAGDHSNWPNQRGFDRFYGNLSAATTYWDPVNLIEDNRPIRAPPDYYYTEALAQKAIEYVDDAVRSGAPFFLYAAFTAPHYPLHARRERIAKYRGRYDAGWDALRAARLARMVKLGLLPSGVTLAPRDETSPAWEDEREKKWEAQRMETYAAVVDHLDEAVGRVVDHLAARRILDNTLFLFLSDNGGSAEGHLQGLIERTGKPWRDPGARPTARSGAPVVLGEFPGRPLGADESYGGYGPKWAAVSNTPFRRFKSWVHEGGIATPFIVHWPGGIRARGAITPQVGHIVDLMATCLEVAGASAGETRPGRNPAAASDGRSLVPLFLGRDRPAQPLFWEHEGNRAVRLGRWKLVSEYPGEWRSLRPYPNEGRWELYDLEHDRTETQNLAAAQPGKVRELERLYDSWAAAAGVVPWAQIQQQLAARQLEAVRPAPQPSGASHPTPAN